MPIYAYRCEACGFAKDILQKMSDATLTDCPSCHASSFKKQVTAAGFQLKGSGWYQTDFRNGSNGASKSESKSDGKSDGKSDSADSGLSAKDAPSAAAAACSPGCACH